MLISFKNGKNIKITYAIVSANEIKDLSNLNNTLIKQFEEPKVENKEEKGIEWEITYSDLFKCRVDNDNKINVYYQNSFNIDLTKVSLPDLFKFLNYGVFIYDFMR